MKVKRFFFYVLAIIASVLTACQPANTSGSKESNDSFIPHNEKTQITDENYALIEEFHSKFYNTRMDSLSFIVTRARAIRDNMGMSQAVLSHELEQYCTEIEDNTTSDIVQSYSRTAVSTFFLTILKYGDLLEMKEFDRIRHLFLTELDLWQKLSNRYNDFLWNCTEVEFFSGSISRIYQASVTSDLRQKRMEDMNLLESYLLDDYDSFETGLPNDVAAQTLINNMKYRRSHIYDPSLVDQDRLEYYNGYYNKACTLEPQVESLLNKWVSVRKEISEIIDHDGAKPFRERTSILLYEMALMNHGW